MKGTYILLETNYSQSDYIAESRLVMRHNNQVEGIFVYVSLRFHLQNRRTKLNFQLNFRTMCKLSDLYSGVFQTQSSG